MKLPAIGVALAVFLLGSLSWLSAQQSQFTAPFTNVPRLVRISDTYHPATALPVGPVESATFSIFKDQEGGAPLWQETQNVTLDSENRYNVLIGSTLSEGMPLDLFSASEPRWLGVRFNGPGEAEQPRVQMVSVPYALKASDAETLGGLPAAAYLRAPTVGAGSTNMATVGGSDATTNFATPKPRVTSGATNCIAVFTDSTDLGCSPLWQSGQSVGLGTTTPGSILDIQNGTGSGFVNFLNMKSNYTGGGVGAAGVTLSHQNSTMLMRAYSPGAPGNLANSIGWFALSGSNKLLIGHAGVAAGNDVGFFTNNQWANPQMLLTTNGYLGINNATPAYQLDVVGQINGNNPAISGTISAVSGTVSSPSGIAIIGTNSNTSGTGDPFGVGGTVNGSTGAGVGGLAVQAGAIGVFGLNTASSGNAIGLEGLSNSPNGTGVKGGGYGTGVSGTSAGTSGNGVIGIESSSTGVNFGVQ